MKVVDSPLVGEGEKRDLRKRLLKFLSGKRSAEKKGVSHVEGRKLNLFSKKKGIRVRGSSLVAARGEKRASSTKADGNRRSITVL